MEHVQPLESSHKESMSVVYDSDIKQSSYRNANDYKSDIPQKPETNNNLSFQPKRKEMNTNKERYTYPIKPIPEVITPTQVLACGAHMPTSEQRTFYYLLYITSARLSELKDILTKDVTYSTRKDKEVIHVHLPNKKNKKIITKELAFPIDSTELQEMNTIIKKYWLLKKKQKWKYLFPWANSHTRQNIYYHFATKLPEIKLRATLKRPNKTETIDLSFKLHPHYLRHCRLTHLRKHYKLDALDLQRIAGWSNTKPAQVYIQQDMEDLLEKML